MFPVTVLLLQLQLVTGRPSGLPTVHLPYRFVEGTDILYPQDNGINHHGW